MIQLMVIQADESMKDMTLEHVTSKFVGGVRRRRKDWTEEKIQYGQINGVYFARKNWAGVEPTLDKPMKGTMYVAIHKDKFYQLHTQDLSSEKQALQIGNAALLTFKFDSGEYP